MDYSLISLIAEFVLSSGRYHPYEVEVYPASPYCEKPLVYIDWLCAGYLY